VNAALSMEIQDLLLRIHCIVFYQRKYAGSTFKVDKYFDSSIQTFGNLKQIRDSKKLVSERNLDKHRLPLARPLTD